MGRRGPRGTVQLRDVQRYVADNPGCMSVEVIEALASHLSRRRGYTIVAEALRVGLVVGRRNPQRNGRYALYVNGEGNA